MESAASASPLYTEIVERLRAGGLAPERAGPAVDWLIRALHPAAEVNSGAIPDSVYCGAVQPDYNVQLTVGAPPLGGGGNWDFCIWTPPGDVVMAIVGAANSGVDFTTAALSGDGGADGGVVLSVLYAMPYEKVGVNYGPPVSNIAPATAYPAVNYSLRSVSRPRAYRFRYRGLTVYSVASDLYNSGTIYAAQMSRLTMGGADQGFAGGVDASNAVAQTDAVWARQAYTCVPLAEARFTLFDTQSVTWPFRQGVYMPGRFIGP